MILSLLLLASITECANSSDSEMAECWSQAYRHADVQLNTVWPDVLKAAREADKGFGPTQRRAHASAETDLLASQRAWLKYRDTECAVEGDYAQGGSLENILVGECATEMTRQRIKRLQDIAAGFKED